MNRQKICLKIYHRYFFFFIYCYEQTIFEFIFDDINDETNKSFVMIVRINKQHFKQLKQMHINRRARINAAFIKNEKQFDIKCIIFEILQTYKNKTYEFSKYTSNDHITELQIEFFFIILYIRYLKQN